MSSRVIAFGTEKGGVGKTTLAVHTAFELASRGMSVVVVDNDPQGDAATCLLAELVNTGGEIPDSVVGGSEDGYANTYSLYKEGWALSPFNVGENLYLMAADDSLTEFASSDKIQNAYVFADNIERLTSVFDVVIIDCPPTLGLLFASGVLSTIGFGGVIIPFTLDAFGLKSGNKLMSRICELKEKSAPGLEIIGFVANKVATNHHMPQSVKEFLKQAETDFGESMFETKISNSLKLSDSLFFGVKISDYAKAEAKPSLQISAFVDEITERLDMSGGMK